MSANFDISAYADNDSDSDTEFNVDYQIIYYVSKKIVYTYRSLIKINYVQKVYPDSVQLFCSTAHSRPESSFVGNFAFTI